MFRFFTMLLLLTAVAYPKSYALVIGVNGHNIIGAENDAIAMKKLLKERGVENIIYLPTQKATKWTIINRFKKIAKSANSGDWVYLFFSGHGVNRYSPNIGKKFQNKLIDTGGIVPNISKINFKNIIVIKRDLKKYFNILEKKEVHTVIVFDACFSGTSYKDVYNSMNSGHINLTRDGSKYPYQHIIYMSASTKIDTTSESRSERRGYFSMAVVKCLKKETIFDEVATCINKKYRYRAKLFSNSEKQPIFPKSITKDIVVRFKPKSAKERLFDLAIEDNSFVLYTQKRENQELTQNYNLNTPLDLYLKSDKSGYFVLFYMNPQKNLKMLFISPHIYASNKKRLELTLSEDGAFGEERLIAFLVDKSTAQSLQKIKSRNGGELNRKSEIEEIITILRATQIGSSQITVISQKD